MRFVHVIPHIADEASGPSYSVPRLCSALAEGGHEVELMCLGEGPRVRGVDVDFFAQWTHPRSFAVSPAHARELSRRAGEADIVHNHSLWSMVNVAAGMVVPGKRARLVTSPRGTLSPVALDRRRALKRVLWPLQRRALTEAALIHATSEIEYEQIRAMGLRAPVAIIPNGIDLPAPWPPTPRPSGQPRALLTLGRLHPIKGLPRLLRSWKSLEQAHPEWRLRIVGKGEPHHEREIRALASSLGLARVDFAGPLYGAAKEQAYRDADLFVLASHSENFGVVVAEALANGCPVVTTGLTPWAGLVDEGCGWWVPSSEQAIGAALAEAMSLRSDALSAMGARGRRWMETDFSWTALGHRLAESYEWLLQGGPPPSSVRLP